MLEVLVLGTAAGGGLPQWNCACENCGLARSGFLTERTQSSIAVSANGRDWHVINASPDIARQIDRFLWPRLATSSAIRQMPLRSVFLTNADLDHSLGLFQLREGGLLSGDGDGRGAEQPFDWTRRRSRARCYGGVEWRAASGRMAVGGRLGLEVRAVPLAGGGPPRFDATAAPGGQAVGYLFRAGEVTLGFFPDVALIDAALRDELARCERVWFDGTFWSDGEMLDCNGRTALAMGHVPVGGAGGSLETLRRCDLGALPIFTSTTQIRSSGRTRRNALRWRPPGCGLPRTANIRSLRP